MWSLLLDFWAMEANGALSNTEKQSEDDNVD